MSFLRCAASALAVAVAKEAAPKKEVAPGKKVVTPSGGKKEADKKVVDPEKELLRAHRVVYLTGRVDEKSSRRVVTSLLHLNSLSEAQPITLLINSGGGSVTDGMAIYDVMQTIDAPVHTVCCGRCSSMAAVLLAGGEAGKRRAMPNARVMIHEASRSSDKVQVTDFELRCEELRRKNAMLLRALARDCGKTEAQMRTLFGRDLHMSAVQAMEMGLVDGVASKADMRAAFQGSSSSSSRDATDTDTS